MLLAITTSTAEGGVAVLDGERVLSEVSYDGGAAHAERLLPAIEEALSSAGVLRSALTRIACDVGPGSFTGVRVAVSLAKGLALGLGIGAVGVGSLEAMAAEALSTSHPAMVGACLDARRDEVFIAAYDAALEVVLPVRIARADGPLASLFPAGTHVATRPPKAVWIGRVALRKGGPCDPAALDPAYAREPDALTLEQQRISRALAKPDSLPSP